MAKQYTPKEIRLILKARARARTDLLYLAREVLGYSKITEEVHGGLIASLQKFDEAQGRDSVQPEGFHYYEPKYADPLPLPGARRRLILDARGHYKTTINTIAHTIQWILNFPDITLLLIHASLPQAQEKYAEIRDHFRYNKTLRYLFPDFCPAQKNAHNWGTTEEFTTPARKMISGTPTVSVASIDKVKAGSHYHVMKFFDVVEKENSQTREQIQKTIRSFGAFRFLLVSAKYWIDVEGTRYDFSDLYGVTVDEYLKQRKAGTWRAEDPLRWHFYVRGCYKKDTGGKPPTYQPEELELPYLLDEKGRQIPVFPEINTWEDLEALRNDPSMGGPELFAAQMLNNPVDTGGTAVFPLQNLQWVPARKVDEIKGPYRITVDTANTVGESSNNSVITACKRDRTQRRYVREIRLGKFLPDELLDHLFEMILRYRPEEVRIEKTMYVDGLKPSIDQRCTRLEIWPNFVFLPRDTQVQKQVRIRLALQPWFKAGMIRFSDDFPEHVKEQLRNELARFPRYHQDDILDTLADQFQGDEFFGPADRREIPEDPVVAEALERQEIDRYITKAYHHMIYGAPAETGNGEDAMTGL